MDNRQPNVIKLWVMRMKFKFFRGKSNYLKHFESELKILRKGLGKDGRLLIEPYIPEIKKIINKFSDEGHSGYSAPMSANALSNSIKRTLLFEPLSPITGEESEWNSRVADTESYQNNRLSSVFKDKKNNKPYYLFAITWKTQNGTTWNGSALKNDGTRATSRQYVKLPFIPKTFTIDVIEKEVAKDNWEFYIKDEKQLEEVFKYYEEYKPDAA
jgi:hypothetical protein